LQKQKTWQHNFGLGDDPEHIIGKMFGVLVVQDPQGELGFLCAFSGKLAEQNHHQGFVPPIFDNLHKHSFFSTEQAKVNQLNGRILLLEQDPQLAKLQQQWQQQHEAQKQQVSAHRAKMISHRSDRKAQRLSAQNNIDQTGVASLLETLSQQSIEDKLQLKRLNLAWADKLAQIEQPLMPLEDRIKELKAQRKSLSSQLQQRLFAEYRFLNQQHQALDLQQIFSQTALRTPPAGAGECAAPKLLQYAFQEDLKPIALAEFWWGASPKSEVRQHKQYYPACLGKCQPILTHMLEGIKMDDNPMLTNRGAHQALEIQYQDPDIVIVHKPCELLSVPGKQITDSVYERIKQQFPQARGPLIVHRLDMSTSGLMVIALHPKAHKHLQRQFINREVKKSYVALIEGLVPEDQGLITLPLRGDLYDRPRQLVCAQFGKSAHTQWQVIERNLSTEQTRVLLFPKTGRTHQLRVHCAHNLGLNMPIVGDDLYGKAAKRLHLHAQRLELQHPNSKEWLCFERPADF
jgi:tRNA pseudouridine32 synthase/23S rRNA pseudouridine746 synthase